MPTGPPSNIASDSFVKNQLLLTWDQPVCGSRNGEMSKYEYAFGIDLDNGEPMYGSTEPNRRMVTLTDLQHYTTYEFQIYARTSVGAGPYSDVVEVTTSESSKFISGLSMHANKQINKHSTNKQTNT